MVLTRKQELGLRTAVERFNQNKNYTVISGYAGSGKSTLVKFIIAALGCDEDEVVFTSFTGKATQVLLKKGNKNVSTLHKLLYTWRPLPTGGYLKTPVEDIPYKVVVVDEVSMVPKSLINALLMYDVYVLFCGDPYQLPQISKEDTHDLLDHPHVFLDEIMRQAAESEIIRLSMDIRQGKDLSRYVGKEIMVLNKDELNEGMLTWADQIICAKNDTRFSLNMKMKELLGKGAEPAEGDKIICLRNYWETIADTHNPLVNGTIGYMTNVYKSHIKYPKYLGDLTVPYLGITFTSDSDDKFKLDIDETKLTTEKNILDWATSYKINKSSKFKGSIPLEFAYGYAITCHRAQGSEWDKVLVVEENFPFVKEEHSRWLYTACTRAAEKLVIIRK